VSQGSPPIELLYVDEHVVVANKPSGLLVHRGWDNDDDVALFRVRDAIGAWVYPVHRLDRGTSGALLFARSSEMAGALGRAIEQGLIEKRYLALVRGEPPAGGLIDYPIPGSEGGARVAAVTRYRMLGRSPIERCSLVEAVPLTGRLHQIRRHLRHLNHPLVGDVNYGSGEVNRHFRATYGLHRLALHATELIFPHPATGERVAVRARVAPELATVLAALGFGPGVLVLCCARVPCRVLLGSYVAAPTNSLDFDCDWRYGFNLNPRQKGTVGYLLFWSGCGGLNLTKDVEVWNPYNGTQGQTIVSGAKVSCIGLLESFRFQGGEEDPIRITAYVSKDTAANVRAKLASPLQNTKVKVQWYIISYDDEAKNWYESALITDSAKATSNIDTARGQVQMFIDNKATQITETLDIRVYRFEFQIIPGAGATTNLQFATGASQKLVKQWGVEE
jgi:tRNA pseudouridine65 synthase